MSQPRIYLKVAKDMFLAQGMWAVSFLGVMLTIQIMKIGAWFFSGSSPNIFFDATFIAANIFMIVIGIISTIGFVPYFVGHGVTRKDYFKGTIIGTLGVAIAIPVVTAIISSLIDLLIKLVGITVQFEPFNGNEIGDEGFLPADILLAIIFTPYVDLSSNWVMSIIVFVINLFTYYIAGWLIGSAFSRLSVLGILSIPLAFILIYVEDLLLSFSLGLPVSSFVGTVEIPFIVSIIGIAVAIGITCLGIRQLTKNLVVKV